MRGYRANIYALYNLLFITLVLFAALICAEQPKTCRHLITKRPQCFDEAYVSGRNSVPNSLFNLLGLRNKINMEVAGWQSQALLTFAFEILLREKLGYEVDLLSYDQRTLCIMPDTFAQDHGFNDFGSDAGNWTSPSEAQYLLLSLGKKTFDVELWPTLASPARRYILNRVDIKNPAKVGFDGLLGPMARSGWFINSQALQGLNFDTLSLIEANGGFNTSSPVHLMLSSDFPVYNDIFWDPNNYSELSFRWRFCSGNEIVFLPEHQGGGVLDCALWSWAPTNSTCCTRSMMNASSCNGLHECFAILFDTPGHVFMNRNSLRIAASNAPIEAIFTGLGMTPYVVENAIAVSKPTIFYHWEPDLLIEPHVNDAGEIIDYKFSRVNMLDDAYCANEIFYESKERSSYTTAFPDNGLRSVCDYPSDMLEKASYLPDKLYFQDAFHLFSKFKVNFEQSWNLINQTRNASLIAQRDSISNEWDFNRTGLFGGLLGIFSDNKNTTEDERIDLHTSLLYSLSACEWLKQNPNLWEEYIVPNVYFYEHIKVLTICISIFFVYAFSQFIWLHRRGGPEYDIEVTKALEILEAMQSDCYSAGKRKILDAVDMLNKPVKSSSTDHVSFIVKQISCRKDEDFVEFSINSSSRYRDVYLVCKPGPYRSEVPETCGKLPHAKIHKDYSLPYVVEQKVPLSIVNTHTVRISSLDAGVTKLRLPILRKNYEYSPVRMLHIELQPGCLHEDTDSLAFSSSLPVLEVYIYSDRPFMQGSGSVGLNQEGKSFLWPLNSIFVLIKNCLYIDVVASRQWKFQLMQLSIALLETFWWSHLFQELIDKGLILKRTDFCIWAGLWFIFIGLFKFHCGLHYFSGSFKVRTYFQQLLFLKSSLLSSSDWTQFKDSESYFRATIFNECEGIQEKFWKPLNEILMQIFRIIGASTFLWFMFKDELGTLFVKLIYIAPFSFLGFSIIFLLFRCTRILKIGYDEDKFEISMYSSAQIILRSNILLREVKSAVDFCSLQYDKLWSQLHGGLFEQWYFMYYNFNSMQICQVVIVAIFYALPNKFLKDYDGDAGKATVGQFLVSMSALIQVLMSCVEISVLSSTVLEVLSKVEHISELLNFKTSEELRIENKPLDESGMRDHEGTEVVQETKSQGDNYLFEFDDVTLDYPPRNVFKKCSMEDRSSRRVTRISQGGIVGILRSSDGSAKAFFNVLCREDVPLHGKCGFAPKLYFARVNSYTGAFLESATLRSNLLITAENRLKSLARHSPASFVFLDQIRGYTSHVIWDVCKSVGLSVAIIGERHNPDWSTRRLDEDLKLMDDVDLTKLRLVRALLALPDVLVMDEFGDDMTTEDLNDVVKVLRQYLEFKLPGIDETSASALLKAKSSIRTILWSGHERTLRPHLDPKNRVLSLQSVSKIAVDGAW